MQPAEAIGILRGDVSPSSVLHRGIAEKMGAEALERIVALEAALEAKHQQYTGAVIQLTEARKDGERWAFARKHADMFRISARGKKKKQYSVHVAFTNYEYDVFPTIDEAMDATMRGPR